MSTARELIERLALAPHPEGGWFRETHRSDLLLPQDALPDGYRGDRAAATSILFLLEQGQRSAKHRVRSEEIWLHQGGDDLELIIRAEGEAERRVRLGLGPGATPQAVVPPGAWQEAAPLAGEHGYVLVGCVVAPGFDFADFEMEGTA